MPPQVQVLLPPVQVQVQAKALATGQEPLFS
jgi:hypothetical protein